MSRNFSRIRTTFSAGIIASGLLLVLNPLLTAHASTVLEVGVADMLEHCELIFEGDVVEVWSEASPRGIHTWVRFEVRDVLLGPQVGPSLVLSFLGGRAGDRIEKVIGLRVPEHGEHGFYFVESLRRSQVNPLYGWDQGRLLIVPDRSGRPRVVTADGWPVVAVDRVAVKGLGRLSSRVAKGIWANPETTRSHALSPTELKAALAALPQAKRARAKSAQAAH